MAGDASSATGDPAPTADRAASALTRLQELPGRPTAEHVAIYEAAHRDLQEALAEAARRSDADGPPDAAAAGGP